MDGDRTGRVGDGRHPQKPQRSSHKGGGVPTQGAPFSVQRVLVWVAYTMVQQANRIHKTCAGTFRHQRQRTLVTVESCGSPLACHWGNRMRTLVQTIGERNGQCPVLFVTPRSSLTDHYPDPPPSRTETGTPKSTAARQLQPLPGKHTPVHWGQEAVAALGTHPSDNAERAAPYPTDI